MATNHHHHPHHCSIVITTIISNLLLQVNLPSRALLLRAEDVQGAIVEFADKNRMF